MKSLPEPSEHLALLVSCLDVLTSCELFRNWYSTNRTAHSGIVRFSTSGATVATDEASTRPETMLTARKSPR